MKPKGIVIVVIGLSILFLIGGYFLLSRTRSTDASIGNSQVVHIRNNNSSLPGKPRNTLKRQQIALSSLIKKATERSDNAVLGPIDACREIHESEPVNEEWTRECRNKYLDYLSSLSSVLKETQLYSVDCRETICLVVFLHESKNEHDIFYERSVISESPVLTSDEYGFTGSLDDGSWYTAMYFSPAEDNRLNSELKSRLASTI